MTAHIHVNQTGITICFSAVITKFIMPMINVIPGDLNEDRTFNGRIGVARKLLDKACKLNKSGECACVAIRNQKMRRAEIVERGSVAAYSHLFAIERGVPITRDWC